MTSASIPDPDRLIKALSQSKDGMRLLKEADCRIHSILSAIITLHDVDITDIVKQHLTLLEVEAPVIEALVADLTGFQENLATLVANTYSNIQVVSTAIQRLWVLAYNLSADDSFEQETNTPTG